MHFIALSGRQFVSGLLWPLLQLMLTIAAGLAIGPDAGGGRLDLAPLHPGSAAFPFRKARGPLRRAFTAAFVSGVAANAMLQDFYRENKITREQLYLANFVNQLPAFFLHLPTTFFTVISMTGAAGVFYFVLTFSGRLAPDLRFSCVWPVAAAAGVIS